jgi:hypothetical protein
MKKMLLILMTLASTALAGGHTDKVPETVEADIPAR